ncbi:MULTISPECIES: helix-turn-helix domain-containing protein [unclassified Streptomyces]|uniref:helix-turn-helix domain-containing protein n=1 Tax=unclassified Streptomyces TaxID=2593676 RepID=UPI002E3120D4|nr:MULTISPECIES: helix-turn-helix domain-containing protein [unclassified Streptomyces]WUC66381.1 PucR family transcriptional regulator [Streptomyces sp. NBC_00539]
MPDQPPTTGVALSALLADRELGLRGLYAAEDVAGPATVHAVHASEMADPSPYLLGGELLLTAGAHLGPDADGYVARLVAAGAAALGFGVAPVYEVVPPELVAACARHGLPLLEVPPGTPFTAVARTVWRLMAEARTRELRRVTEAQQALAAAAARPDPVPAVLRRLAAALGGRVVLLRGGPGGGAGSGEAGREVPPGAEAALEALLGRVAAPGGPATATDSAAGWQLSAYALGGGAAPAGPGPGAAAPPHPAPVPGVAVLGVAVPERTPGDHAITAIAAVLLGLLTTHRPAGAEAAALTRLLLDGDPAAALAPGPWQVVHARGAGDPQALAGALGTVLLDALGPELRLVTDRDPVPQPGWRLGVSAPARPGALPTADTQARRALERAEAARTALVRHSDAGLPGLLDPARARAHAEALLAPLTAVQAATLRGWLAHHGSWDRSAAVLGVHRNTVRQRIARCSVLLGRDLDDPDTRMELWFALRTLDSGGNSPVT